MKDEIALPVFLKTRVWLPVRVLAGTTVALMLAGLLIMGQQPVAVGLFTPPWDKLAHLLVFAIIGAATGLAGGASGYSRLVWCVFGAVAVGAIDELHQHYLPGRAASWADLLADGIGGLLGGAALYFVPTALLQQPQSMGGRRRSEKPSKRG